MKKYIYLFALLLTAASCAKTNEEIARAFIESQIKEGMNDPSSYEFVSLTPLDSVFSEFKDEPQGKEIRKEINELDIKMRAFEKLSEDTYSNRYTFTKKQMQQFKDSMNYYFEAKKEKDSYYALVESNYKPKMKGYKTTFTFRGKNAFGAIIKNSYELYLNEKLDSIVNVKDVE